MLGGALAARNRRIRKLVAKEAIYARLSREDLVEMTAPARRGRLRKLEDEVDPDRVLPEAERQRRVDAALRREMTRLSRLAAKKRAKGRR
jgi:hypothetical protein